MNQAPQLVKTKLHFPKSRHNLVPRPRLIERLDDGLHGKLTLISAPAGFGKTTLLSQWISSHKSPDDGSEQKSGNVRRKEESESIIQLRESEFRVGWLSLDEGDNDLTRFLAYFAAALQSVEEGFGEGTIAVLHTPQPPPMDVVLTSLLNEISDVNEAFTLVLDDYHHITAQPVHDAVAYLFNFCFKSP